MKLKSLLLSFLLVLGGIFGGALSFSMPISTTQAVSEDASVWDGVYPNSVSSLDFYEENNNVYIYSATGFAYFANTVSSGRTYAGLTIYLEEDIDLEIKEIYPEELSNIELEKKYIGMLLKNPKAISMYYILFEDCYFESDSLLNLYKSILFTEGEEYAPQIAKNNFNFAKETYDVKKLRVRLKEEAAKREDNYEKIYLETMKLFEIRKNHVQI